MNKSTKQLFNAPLRAEEYKHGKGAFVVRNNGGYLVAENMSGQDAARLARLPELYDSLLDAVNDACGACAMMHIQDGYDFVTNGCPFEENEDCKCLKWISVLRKVRNAE